MAAGTTSTNSSRCKALQGGATRLSSSSLEAVDALVVADSSRGSSKISAEVSKVFRLAWPQSTAQLCAFAPGTILLLAVGHLPNGAVLVGAAGMALMYANFSQKMLLLSTTFGATPLFSQAFGAGNHHRVGHLLMRVLILHTLLAACAAVPLTAAAGFLFSLAGLPEEVTQPAQTFLWIRLVGVPGMILFVDVQCFLNAQRFVQLPMLVMVAGALTQAALVTALTRPSVLGFEGAPWALTIVELAQGLAIYAAAPCLLRRHKLRTWPAWVRDARHAFEGWVDIVTRGGPACVMIMSEWGGWECTLFVASGLCSRASSSAQNGATSEPPLSSISNGSSPALSHSASCPAIEAIPICTTIFVCQFLVAFGPGLAANIRVGNLLGAGRPREAIFCARVAWCMAMAITLVEAVVLLSLRDPIAAAFVDDAEVRAHVARLLPYTTLYSCLATCVSGFSQQILFGVGARLRVAATINLVAFFGVGLPLGTLLAFHASMDEEGIWLGLVVAMILALIGQYAYLYVAIDWHAAAQKARQRALSDASATTTTTSDDYGCSDSVGLAAMDAAAVVERVAPVVGNGV